MPLPKSYDEITLSGDAYFDYLWINQRVLTNDELEKVNVLNFRPQWEDSTILLANYDDSLSGGNILSLEEPVQSWLIYKRREDAHALTFINEIPADVTKISDYAVNNHVDYQYVIFPVTENTIGDPMFSEISSSSWWNWCLVDIIPFENGLNRWKPTGTFWIFTTNLKSGTTQQTIDTYTYDGFLKYPKVSYGKRNYSKGSLNCFLSNVLNNSYSDNAEMREEFKKFISNGNQKLLKDIKGSSYIVTITGASFKVEDDSSLLPIELTFEWTQIEDANNYIITEEINTGQ